MSEAASAMRSDDPVVVLLGLRVVEAITLEDSQRLEVVLREASAGGRTFAVMLSIAALASELLGSVPDGGGKLREWMLATELEIPSDTTETPGKR